MEYQEEVGQFTTQLKETEQVPDYFINLFLNGHKVENVPKKKCVGIIGDEFYSLYLRASGLKPIFIQGGSYNTGENVSHIFPQISDPVAKSTLGLLMDEELAIYKNIGTLFITATNDSYKKSIPYLKEQNINIIEIEPPSYVEEKMPLSYISHQLGVLNKISKIANTRLSETKLKKELNGCKEAYIFTKTDKWQSLPTLVQDFLLHTLYLEGQKEIWCKEVQTYLESRALQEHHTHKLLMIGSPLKFPCSKMYEIFSDVGKDIKNRSHWWVKPVRPRLY